MALSAGQEFLLDGFRDHTRDIYGRTIWVGAPDYESAVGVFEQIDELDPDFALAKDAREACRLHVASDVILNVQPGSTIVDGVYPAAPDQLWRVIPGSRRQNPIGTTTSWLVEKVIPV